MRGGRTLYSSWEKASQRNKRQVCRVGINNSTRMAMNKSRRQPLIRWNRLKNYSVSQVWRNENKCMPRKGRRGGRRRRKNAPRGNLQRAIFTKIYSRRRGTGQKYGRCEFLPAEGAHRIIGGKEELLGRKSLLGRRVFRSSLFHWLRCRLGVALTLC